MWFNPTELGGQPMPTASGSGAEERYELLRKFIHLLNLLGYQGIIVLIDRVDEPQMIEGDPRKMRALVWPLLDHKFLRHPGIGTKMLLPIELAYYLEKEDKEFYDKARPDKLNMIKPLRWTGPSLYDLATDRLRACATERPGRRRGPAAAAVRRRGDLRRLSPRRPGRPAHPPAALQVHAPPARRALPPPHRGQPPLGRSTPTPSARSTPPTCATSKPSTAATATVDRGQLRPRRAGTAHLSRSRRVGDAHPETMRKRGIGRSPHRNPSQERPADGMDSLAPELDFVKALALEAAELARGRAASVTPQEKANLSYVTDLDRDLERLIRDRLAARFPDDRITGEEYDDAGGTGPRRWSIDPIDGTGNLVHQVPLWAISIGLLDAGEPVLGVIAIPPLGELFWAVKGGGAWKDGDRLEVSDADRFHTQDNVNVGTNALRTLIPGRSPAVSATSARRAACKPSPRWAAWPPASSWGNTPTTSPPARSSATRPVAASPRSTASRSPPPSSSPPRPSACRRSWPLPAASMP